MSVITLPISEAPGRNTMLELILLNVSPVCNPFPMLDQKKYLHLLKLSSCIFSAVYGIYNFVDCSMYLDDIKKCFCMYKKIICVLMKMSFVINVTSGDLTWNTGSA